jgi:hypothetical protein
MICILLDSGLGLFVQLVCGEIHHSDKPVDLIDTVEDIPKVRFGVTRRQ